MTSDNRASSDQDRTLSNRLDVPFALQAAGLGVWELDQNTGMIHWDLQCQHLFGLTQAEQLTYAQIIALVYPADVERVNESLQNAFSASTGGTYDVTYRTLSAIDGKLRWVRFQGRSYFKPTGELDRFGGIAQDVTHQVVTQQQLQASEARYRSLSNQLEQQVQQRTQELADNNEELLAASKQAELINQQLVSLNQNLTRSNQNLEQFAYIASHDLQEPLRKIQSFGDLLKTRYLNTTGEELVYLDRMQLAASRMSQLIRDLLTFSRISTSQVQTSPVSLVQLVNQVLDDLSVVVLETKAQIELQRLPTVQGDRLQLSQLFYNLLSNALKFSQRTLQGEPATPRISVQSQRIAATDLPNSVKPSRQSLFYECIEVKDNGIGLDEKYLDRIFQVFQRLHTKSEFAGTGIGLAIAQKVVDNHGGAIMVRSQPGQGASFYVYLPD